MSSWTDTQRTVLRAGLVALTVAPAWIGAWATAAPHSFYGNFPAAGRHWVAGLPPYNEHLVRDYASASLGFLVLLVFAAVVLERRLVQGALLAYAIAGIPHLAYHVATIDHFRKAPLPYTSGSTMTMPVNSTHASPVGISTFQPKCMNWS